MVYAVGLGMLFGVHARGQQAAPAVRDLAGRDMAVRCAGMTGVALEGAKVTSAVMVPAGGAIADVKLPAWVTWKVPGFCRVRVTDTPTSDSDIQTEVWLPLAGWNGRYRATGNGGFAGEIYFGEMAAAVTEGFATSGTDTGHAEPTAGFALGHPEKVKDFGWRAVHDMTVETKVLVKALYGRPAEHSYFASCSDGGREALMEAQRFPEDFDGILAGAPAYHWTALVAAGTKDDQTLMASAGAYLPASKLPAITAAVLAACDGRDGLKDGVVGDPATCRFDPAVLACAGEENDGCLTAPQVATLQEIYAAKRDAQGREVFPGYSPGAESAPGELGHLDCGEEAGGPNAAAVLRAGILSGVCV